MPSATRTTVGNGDGVTNASISPLTASITTSPSATIIADRAACATARPRVMTGPGAIHAQPMRKAVAEIVPKVAEEYQPAVWNLLPKAGRDAVVQRVQEIAPVTIIEFVASLRDNIDEVFDLQEMVTAEFLAHQRSIGNDLSTPMPEYRFPGLVPGDRWCVTAHNWARAYQDGAAAPVVLAATNEKVLELIPLDALQQLAVDVPDTPGDLEP